jgi:hypothetical protein
MTSCVTVTSQHKPPILDPCEMPALRDSRTTYRLIECDVILPTTIPNCLSLMKNDPPSSLPSRARTGRPAPPVGSSDDRRREPRAPVFAGSFDTARALVERWPESPLVAADDGCHPIHLLVAESRYRSPMSVSSSSSGRSALASRIATAI